MSAVRRYKQPVQSDSASLTSSVTALVSMVAATLDAAARAMANEIFAMVSRFDVYR